jgi:hypothetical protein
MTSSRLLRLLLLVSLLLRLLLLVSLLLRLLLLVSLLLSLLPLDVLQGAGHSAVGAFELLGHNAGHAQVGVCCCCCQYIPGRRNKHTWCLPRCCWALCRPPHEGSHSRQHLGSSRPCRNCRHAPAPCCCCCAAWPCSCDGDVAEALLLPRPP